MDQRGERKINRLFNKFSSREVMGSELNEQRLMYNVISFIPMTSMADTSILISNLGVKIAEKGLNTCIVDFDVFYPTIANRFNLVINKKGSGLYQLLKDDKADIREAIMQTEYEQLYVLSASNQDLFEEYYDIRMEQIDELISRLKERFDMIIILVPNNPAFEFCVGALKNSHMGFIVGHETAELTTHSIKFLNYLRSIGVSTSKLSNIILFNALGYGMDYKGFEEVGLKIVGAFPFVKGVYKCALNNEVYISESTGVNRQFAKEVDRITEQLVED